VKVLPSLGTMARFRKTITYGISMKLSGKTFKSAKVLWGTSQYTFHSWNRRHKVRATQCCSSSDFGKEPNSYKSVMAARTTDIPHTLTHTKLVMYSKLPCMWISYILWSDLHPLAWPEVMEHHTAFYIPSVSTVLKIDFDSRRLPHA
jgi:hypothetical protein